jgi:hypothetical protein
MKKLTAALEALAISEILIYEVGEVDDEFNPEGTEELTDSYNDIMNECYNSLDE